jgi:hypothetical protein
MKARTIIVTASAFLALAGPAAHTAGAMIPRDEGIDAAQAQRSAQAASSKAAHSRKATTDANAAAAAAWGNRYAYVPGGASAQVAKAIAAAAREHVARTKVRVVTKTRVVRVPVYVYVTAPSPANEPGAYCLTYASDCTDVQTCEFLGIDCSVAPPATGQPAAEQTPVSTEAGTARESANDGSQDG